MRHLFPILLAVAGAMAAATTSAASPLGVWLTEDNQGAVEIFACGDKLCGRLVWIDESEPPPGAVGPPVDLHNPDPALRQRPLCGLVILQNFVPSEDKLNHEGTIYNPEDGQTYSARFMLENNSTLKLRGYVLLPLLGRSQHWRRAPAEFSERCAATTAKTAQRDTAAP
ncbi:MAG: DUF2147 domain-containing protein [Azospirillum sp.]|nr:DUF2147 domain-containing protein [Azospirillum sp.]